MGEAIERKLFKYKEKDSCADNAELLAVRAKIHPEGSDATLTLFTTSGQIDLTARIQHFASVVAELRAASHLMQYRQTQTYDEGETTLRDMILAAAEPAAVAVIGDSSTGDKTFVLQFGDRLPVVFRLGAEQLNGILEEIRRESMRIAN